MLGRSQTQLEPLFALRVQQAKFQLQTALFAQRVLLESSLLLLGLHPAHLAALVLVATVLLDHCRLWEQRVLLGISAMVVRMTKNPAMPPLARTVLQDHHLHRTTWVDLVLDHLL